MKIKELILNWEEAKGYVDNFTQKIEEENVQDIDSLIGLSKKVDELFNLSTLAFVNDESKLKISELIKEIKKLVWENASSYKVIRERTESEKLAVGTTVLAEITSILTQVYEEFESNAIAMKMREFNEKWENGFNQEKKAFSEKAAELLDLAGKGKLAEMYSSRLQWLYCGEIVCSLLYVSSLLLISWLAYTKFSDLFLMNFDKFENNPSFLKYDFILLILQRLSFIAPLVFVIVFIGKLRSRIVFLKEEYIHRKIWAITYQNQMERIDRMYLFNREKAEEIKIKIIDVMLDVIRNSPADKMNKKGKSIDYKEVFDILEKFK